MRIESKTYERVHIFPSQTRAVRTIKEWISKTDGEIQWSQIKHEHLLNATILRLVSLHKATSATEQCFMSDNGVYKGTREEDGHGAGETTLEAEDYCSGTYRPSANHHFQRSYDSWPTHRRTARISRPSHGPRESQNDGSNPLDEVDLPVDCTLHERVCFCGLAVGLA